MNEMTKREQLTFEFVKLLIENHDCFKSLFLDALSVVDVASIMSKKLIELNKQN